jgi:tRNA pseudouridine38-40 synthase
VATYQSILAYDGTRFAGFQRQRGRRTVQGELEKALRRLGWRARAVRAAGRTDTGVHATGQVVAYDCDWTRGPGRLTQALNALLPDDMAVLDSAEAAPGFHPRYAARGRQYRYRIIAAPVRQPMAERFAWRVWPAPRFELMRAASAALIGEHDFGAFGVAPRRGSHTRRTVRRAEWEQDGNAASLVIEADAFLYHMVRKLAAALVAVGQERVAAGVIVGYLASPEGKWQGSIAPAHGLCLERVIFDEAQTGS